MEPGQGQTLTLEPPANSWAATRNGGYNAGRYDSRMDFIPAAWEVCVAVDMIAVNSADVNEGGIKMLVAWTWRDARNINDASKDRRIAFPKFIGTQDYSTNQGGQWLTRWTAPPGHGLAGIVWTNWDNSSIKIIQFVSRDVATHAQVVSSEFGAVKMRGGNWANGLNAPRSLILNSGWFVSGANIFFNEAGLAQGWALWTGVQWFQALYGRDLTPLKSYLGSIAMRFRALFRPESMSAAERQVAIDLTPTDRQSQDQIANAYCSANPDAEGCWCWKSMPDNVKGVLGELAGSPRCWNLDCAKKGYQTLAMQTGDCIDVTVCTQNNMISGSGVKLTDNIIAQDCSKNNTPVDIPPQSGDASPGSTLTSIPTELIVLILLIIIILLIANVWGGISKLNFGGRSMPAPTNSI